jgi:hypothetical protein
MTTRTNDEARRRSNNRSSGITLAVVQEQIAQLAQGQDRMLHIMEGNGKPGIQDRVNKVEAVAEQAAAELRTLVLSVQKLSDAVGKVSTVVTAHVDPSNALHVTPQMMEIEEASRTHLVSDNPQHKTLLVALLKSPGTVLRWTGVIVVAIYILAQSGVLAEIGKLLSYVH